MQTINLNLSTSLNQALNQDGVTLLRSLSLQQGATYTVNLAFYDGATPFTPSIGSFAFNLRGSDGSNLLSVNSAVSQTGAYPYYFSFNVSSPTLTTALGSSAYVDFQGVISFTDGADLTAIEPFTIRVFATEAITSPASFVSSLNGLGSDITLAGVGSVGIAVSGQNILISGEAPTGSFYPLTSNPSGYLTSSALAPYATTSSLTGASGILQGQINTLDGLTGTFYPRTNPSGYLAALPSNVVLTAGAQTISGSKTFANEAFFPSGASGVFYGDGSHLTGIVGVGGSGGASNAVLLTGNQTISGNKTFAGTTECDTLKTNEIYDGSDVLAMDVLGRLLEGISWRYSDGSHIPGFWQGSATLTAYTEPGDATPASLTLFEPWSAAVDGDTVTVTTNSDNITFTFRDSPSSPTDIQTVGDDPTGAANFTAAVNGQSTLGVTASNGDGVTMTTNASGSSQSISVSGTFSGFSPASATGSDGSSASGTKFATLAAVNSNTNTATIINIVATVAADSTWNTDVEIGYGSDGNDGNFTAFARIPGANLQTAATPVTLFNGLIVFDSPSEAENFVQGTQGLPIIVRTASSGLLTDESGGTTVTILANGLQI